MTKIIGRAELIANDDYEHSDSAETILSSADDLMSTSEQAREVEQMMAGTKKDGSVALAEVVESVIEDYRTTYPNASLSVDIDESLRLSADKRVLSTVLDNLVENALAHNNAPTPVVTVGARATDGDVQMYVSDNGPGIPEHERAVIEAGDENSLEHGSGLGLWTVKWGVVQLGGELRFSENQPQGTVITIDLPTGTQADPIVSSPHHRQSQGEAN